MTDETIRKTNDETPPQPPTLGETMALIREIIFSDTESSDSLRPIEDAIEAWQVVEQTVNAIAETYAFLCPELANHFVEKNTAIYLQRSALGIPPHKIAQTYGMSRQQVSRITQSIGISLAKRGREFYV